MADPLEVAKNFSYLTPPTPKGVFTIEQTVEGLIHWYSEKRVSAKWFELDRDEACLLRRGLNDGRCVAIADEIQSMLAADLNTVIGNRS